MPTQINRFTDTADDAMHQNVYSKWCMCWRMKYKIIRTRLPTRASGYNKTYYPLPTRQTRQQTHEMAASSPHQIFQFIFSWDPRSLKFLLLAAIWPSQSHLESFPPALPCAPWQLYVRGVVSIFSVRAVQIQRASTWEPTRKHKPLHGPLLMRL